MKIYKLEEAKFLLEITLPSEKKTTDSFFIIFFKMSN